MDIWWVVAIDGSVQVPSVRVLVLVNPRNARMVDDWEGAKGFQNISRLDLIATKRRTKRPRNELFQYLIKMLVRVTDETW